MRGNRNQFIKEGEFTCECGRKFTKSQSLYAHQGRCIIHLGDDRYNKVSKRYHTIEGNYVCECGRKFTTNSSYIGHTSHCKAHLGEEAYNRNLSIRRENLKRVSIMNIGTHKSEESRRKQSETRKRKYLSGELTPAKGVGRGKYSYLIYNNTRIMLRSTYEFIYALYLLYNNTKFEYESVRVKSVTDYKYAKSFISDFLIGNTIVEIKGFKTSKLYHAKAAFESEGYNYKVITWTELSEYYEYLKSKLDIDKVLELIRQGNNKGNKYYEHIFISE